MHVSSALGLEPLPAVCGKALWDLTTTCLAYGACSSIPARFRGKERCQGQKVWTGPQPT